MTLLCVIGCAFLLAFATWTWSYSARLRQTSSDRFVESLNVVVGAHGLWSGVWLAEVSPPLAAVASQAASQSAAAARDPGLLVQTWRGAGAQLLAHLPGPAVTTVAEGCGWLQYAAVDLLKSPLVGPLALRSSRILAIAYITREAPRTDRRTWEDVEQILGKNACQGAAFVLLPDARQGIPDARRSLLFVLTMFGAAGFLGAIGLAGYVISREVGATKPHLPEPPPAAAAAEVLSALPGPAATTAPVRPPERSLPPPPSLPTSAVTASAAHSRAAPRPASEHPSALEPQLPTKSLGY